VFPKNCQVFLSTIHHHRLPKANLTQMMVIDQHVALSLSKWRWHFVDFFSALADVLSFQDKFPFQGGLGFSPLGETGERSISLVVFFFSSFYNDNTKIIQIVIQTRVRCKGEPCLRIFP